MPPARVEIVGARRARGACREDERDRDTATPTHDGQPSVSRFAMLARAAQRGSLRGSPGVDDARSRVS